MQYTLSIHEVPAEKIQEIVNAAECKGPCTCVPNITVDTPEPPTPEEKPADAPAAEPAPAAVPEPSTP